MGFELTEVLIFINLVLNYPLYFKLFNWEMERAPLTECEAVNEGSLRLKKSEFSPGEVLVLTKKEMAWTYGLYVLMLGVQFLIGLDIIYLIVSSLLFFLMVTDVVFNIVSNSVLSLLAIVAIYLTGYDLLVFESKERLMTGLVVLVFFIVLSVIFGGVGFGDIKLMGLLAFIFSYPLFITYLLWQSLVGFVLLVPLLLFKELEIKGGIPLVFLIYVTFYVMVLVSKVWG